ncbi:DUF3097 family protein [Gulosibacter molinativorax]|uniref:DUF3097 domain-containing protein n=1 Tax=Gulosibacter molinativorax TaxID=256821 RepID=A0ABT7C5B2_9MICO|nr:DUF3097 family protein [Gulosibacter molinativorax]MDJ1370375.1 DUF3097 domain-containing protein [Gulosibacter molinativorax]QUY61288.1 Methyl-accepting chemotaxis protein [Gulosibacter molinativorax]
MSFDDRYDRDPLTTFRESKRPRKPREVTARRGMWLEDAPTQFYGQLVAADRETVTLADADGQRRSFPRHGTFMDDEGAVKLAFRAPTQKGPARSASGSFVVQNAPARVARAGRIFVEGKHDAELVEKVWGHDLRVEGVVVEYLEGADHLDAVLSEFGPTPSRRVGVLLDHLVKGSKETRIAQGITQQFGADAVLVVGHPYVDVWQAVRPQRLGREAWPVIPKGQSWKHGICAALGLPHDDQADIANAWRLILDRVRDWKDLEPSVIGRVEELIDFVTAPGE